MILLGLFSSDKAQIDRFDTFILGREVVMNFEERIRASAAQRKTRSGGV